MRYINSFYIFGGGEDFAPVDSYGDYRFRMMHIRDGIRASGLEDVYDTLPSVRALRWYKILLHSGRILVPENLAKCYTYQVEIGKVLETVPPPRNAPEPGPVPIIRLAQCAVCTHFPENPDNLTRKPGVSVVLSYGSSEPDEMNLLNGGELGDNESQKLLSRTRLVEPFRSLSQDWSNPKVISMWYAVLAWYQLHTAEDNNVQWDALFREHFIEALKAIKEFRQNKDNKESNKPKKSEKGVKTEDEEYVGPEIKRESP